VARVVFFNNRPSVISPVKPEKLKFLSIARSSPEEAHAAVVSMSWRVVGVAKWVLRRWPSGSAVAVFAGAEPAHADNIRMHSVEMHTL